MRRALMKRIIAYCGLICTDCPAYRATQAGDHAAVEEVAAEWREKYNAPGITAAYVYCDGCLGRDGRKCGHCAECGIRACGMARAVANCGECPEYTCEKIRAFLAMVPEAKEALDQIAAGGRTRPVQLAYRELEAEILSMLDSHPVCVLATSSGDRVTARTVSVVHDGLTVFCQSDETFEKCRQIRANANVALCFANVQIEGVAALQGHPMAPENRHFAALYRERHPGSFARYSHLPGEVVIAIEPRLITVWKYVEDRPCRDYLRIAEKAAERVFYDMPN